jgi:N-acetylneuraminic acid mutarotase
MKLIATMYVFVVLSLSLHAQIIDTWTQKANFGGSARSEAVGFSIGDKGYIGTGTDGNLKKDFWEYDPAFDAWTQKADFGGSARKAAVGFSLDGKGYIGTGYDGKVKKDFWQYDPSSNTWVEKNGFQGDPREDAVAFTIESFGYLGTGINKFDQLTDDFYRYDPALNMWSNIKKIPGIRRAAVSFSINGKGYVGTGNDGTLSDIFIKDCWEYDPASNTWTQKSDLPGNGREEAVGFSINDKGYIVSGLEEIFTFPKKKDCWEYNPANDSWTQKNNFEGSERTSAATFVIGNNAYLGTGSGSASMNDFWIYETCIPYTVYADFDEDGYGNIYDQYITPNCEITDGYVADNTDCNDANATINPGGIEILNELDDNCNGIIDDITCISPDSLQVVNISTESAKLKWNSVAVAISYKLRYKEAATGSWINLAPQAHSKLIENLTPETNYTWQVKSLCNKNPQMASDWSPKYFFNTLPLKSGSSPLTTTLEVYPNPYTNISHLIFMTYQSGHVVIDIFDLTGKKVLPVFNESVNEGQHEIALYRNHLEAGFYLLVMKIDEAVTVKKIIIH